MKITLANKIIFFSFFFSFTILKSIPFSFSFAEIVKGDFTRSYDSTKTIFIDNDDLVFKFLENDLQIDLFKKTFACISKKVTFNKYNRSLKDTIMKFATNKDSAEFYISKTNTILKTLILNSNKISLDNGKIFISMDQATFKERFHLQENFQTLVIKDFENSSFFIFEFKLHSLYQIKYTANYID